MEPCHKSLEKVAPHVHIIRTIKKNLLLHQSFMVGKRHMRHLTIEILAYAGNLCELSVTFKKHSQLVSPNT
jgi:hypothetical protein